MNIGSWNRTVVAPLTSAIIAVLVAGLVVVGFDQVGPKIQKGTARLDPTGLVEVSVAGAPFVRASHGRTLGVSDQVRVVDGRATLDLPHSSKVELRAGSALTVNGTNAASIVLDAGDLLVEAGRGDTVVVDGGTALVAVAGSAKLRRGASLATGVYQGTAQLRRNDAALTVPQYRQGAVVGTGIMPIGVDPLSLNDDDEWDRRLLASVLSLDDQLNLFAKSFEAVVPAGSGPELYQQASPELASLPLTSALLEGRPSGENVIGLTMVALDKGDFNERFGRIFGFRAEGARWGLVAADRGLNPNPVLNGLESALNTLHPGGSKLPGDLAAPAGRSRSFRLDGRLAPGGGGSGSGGTGSSPSGTGGSPTGGGSGGPGAGGPGTGGSGSGGSGSGGPGSGGGGPGGPGSPPPPPKKKKLIDVQTGTFLDPVLDPVEDLLSGLLGGLLGQPTTGSTAPSTSSTPSQPTATTPAVLPSTDPTVAGAGTTVSAPTTTPSPTTSSTTSTTTTTSGGLLGGVVIPGLL